MPGTLCRRDPNRIPPAAAPRLACRPGRVPMQRRQLDRHKEMVKRSEVHGVCFLCRPWLRRGHTHVFVPHHGFRQLCTARMGREQEEAATKKLPYTRGVRGEKTPPLGSQLSHRIASNRIASRRRCCFVCGTSSPLVPVCYALAWLASDTTACCQTRVDPNSSDDGLRFCCRIYRVSQNLTPKLCRPCN